MLEVRRIEFFKNSYPILYNSFFLLFLYKKKHKNTKKSTHYHTGINFRNHTKKICSVFQLRCYRFKISLKTKKKRKT